MAIADMFKELASRVQQPGGKLQPQTMNTGPVPVPYEANPFAQLAEQAAASPQGFARPEAQQFLQQALSSPYMQGWGGPQAGGMPAPGQAGMAPTGPVSGTPYTYSGQTSKEALKFRKLFQKARKASQFGLDDVANVGLSAGLGYLTGGLGSALISGGTSLFGADKQNKGVEKFMKQFKRSALEHLPSIGWTRKKGRWFDASGKRMGPSAIYQTLMDLGASGQ